MAINTNDATGLKDLPAIPQIPGNVGKLDVGAIYDRVVQGLSAGTALGENAGQQVAQGSALATQLRKNQQTQQLIPSQTQADLATNAATAAQAPLGTVIKQSEATKAAQTTQGAIDATNAANKEAELQSNLGTIYKQAGLNYAKSDADAIEKIKAANITKLGSSTNGFASSPVTGPNGEMLGSLITTLDANGNVQHQYAAAPFAALAKTGSNLSQEFVGPGKPDPQTGQVMTDQYRITERNPYGGIIKTSLIEVPRGTTPIAPGSQAAAASGNPTPTPTTTPQGSSLSQPAPAPQPAAAGSAAPLATNAPAAPVAPGAAPQAGAPLATTPTAIPGAGNIGTTVPGGRQGAEFAGEQAKERAKQRQQALDEFQDKRDQLNQNTFAISKLTNDIKAEQQSTLGSGPIVGGTPILSNLRPTVQAVNADLSNFVSQVMSSAKNIRTQKEFNAFTGAIPSAADSPQVQNDKLNYLGTVTNVMKSRIEFQDALLRTNPNIDPDQADKASIEKFPFPDAPEGGWGVKPAGVPAAAPAAPAAAPAAPAGDQSAQALAWAKANPNDPRSAQILAKLGAQ